MSDWTLTTDDLRDYIRSTSKRRGADGVQEMVAKFDRWLKRVQAEAWDEGHRTPQDREMDDCRCEAWYEHECACGLFGTGDIITPNPYRKENEE